jgi:hypothetical protein
MRCTIKQIAPEAVSDVLAATDHLTYAEWKGRATWAAFDDAENVLAYLVLDTQYSLVDEIWAKQELRYTDLLDQLVKAAKAYVEENCTEKKLGIGFEPSNQVLKLLMGRVGGEAEWITYVI